MAATKSLKGVLCIILCAAMLAGICLAPSAGKAAADRAIAQCGEFAALDILSSIGKALGKAAAKKAANWAVGSVMKAMGLGSPTTADLMKELDKDMAEINAKLDQIQAGITQIEDQMKIYFDKSQALATYADLQTYCTNIKTVYDNWMLKQIEPYNGTESAPRIPPKPGEAGYDDMKANLDQWAHNMADPSSAVSLAIGQIHKDLTDPTLSVLKGIVDVGIDMAGTEWQGQDFATAVRSTNGVPIVADRVMYTRGDLMGAFCGGEAPPQKVHHFAEGYVSREGETRGETFLLIHNQDAARTANVKITFYMTDGTSKVLYVSVGPNSRYTVNSGDHVVGEFGMKVESDTDVAVERSCYLDGRLSGSTVNADAGLMTRKTFAEGYVVPEYFNTYFTLLNPDPAKAADVSVTFYRSDGTTERASVEVGPGSRHTIDAGNFIQGEFSTIIESTNGIPVISERLVYAREGIGNRMLDGATASEGEADFSRSRFFAEGYVVPGYFDTYFSLFNPGAVPAVTTISFMKADGTTTEHRVTVDPGRRATVSAADFLTGEFATGIESTEPISSERITYARSVGGGTLVGANLGQGADEAKTTWNFAEGTNRKNLGARTYLTIANPGTRTARVQVDFQTSEGRTYSKNITVPPRGKTGASSDSITQVSGVGGRVTVDAGAEVQASAVDAWYNDLEDTFVGAVYQRESGANMTVEYMNYLNQDPSYWWGNFIQEEQAEVRFFLAQAYRLALSQVNLVEQPGIPAFPDAAKNVINRANFVADIINNKCDYSNPDDPGYAADLASQCRLLGTVVLGGEVAGPTDTVTVRCSTVEAPTLDATGVFQAGYVEKFRTATAQRVYEYYDTWQGTTMTPRNDMSVYTFSVPGAVGGKTYCVDLMINGQLYYSGGYISQSTDPNGQPYDPAKSAAKIDTLPFVYYSRTGGLDRFADLVRRNAQFVNVKSQSCSPAFINVNDSGYLLNAALCDAYDGSYTNGTLQEKMGLVFNPSADGNMKVAYVYPYCKSMRYLSIVLGAGVTSWNLLSSLSGYDKLTAAYKTNKRGGDWENHWGHGCQAGYSLPDQGWDLNMQLHVDSQPDPSPYWGQCTVQMYVQATGFCVGFY